MPFADGVLTHPVVRVDGGAPPRSAEIRRVLLLRGIVGERRLGVGRDSGNAMQQLVPIFKMATIPPVRP